MTQEKHRWALRVLRDMGLEERLPGYWTDETLGRCVYLGEVSVLVQSGDRKGGLLLQTQHHYPTFPDSGWLIDIVDEHAARLFEMAVEADLVDDPINDDDVGLN